MNDGNTQVTIWKDVEARDEDTADHPAGEVTLPTVRRRLARANALAGYVVGAAMATPVVPTLSLMSQCCSL